MKTKDDALARAASLQPQLARAADRLNDKIREFEGVLESLALGVSARKTLWSDQQEQEAEILAFQKYQGKWRLVVISVDSLQDERDPTPLNGASRETRILAVSMFGDLLEALLAASEQELERLASASSSVDQLVATLRGKT